MNHARLGNLCQIRSGGTPSRDVAEFYGGEIPWAKIDDLNTQSGIVIKTMEGLTQKGLNAIRGRLFPAGTLLFAMYGSVGKLAWAGCEMSTNQAILGVEVVDSNILDRNYLFRWLQSQRSRLESDASGVTQKNLSAGYVRDLLIPLPPIEHQRRIAAVLDKADVIRQKRGEALRQCEVLKASVMSCSLNAAGSVINERIGGLLESGLIALHKDGNHGANYPRAEEFVRNPADGVPFITAKNIRSDGSIDENGIAYLGEEKARQLAIGWLKPGDVLLAHNATVGPVGVFRGEWNRALIGTSLTCFRPNPSKTSTDALFAALSDPFFQQQLRKQMKQTTRNQVPITAQRELRIRLPSGNAISMLTSKLARLKNIYSKDEAFLEDAEQLFASLCDRAFSGQI